MIGIENDHYVFEAKILVLDTDSCPYVIKKNVQKSDYDLNSGMWTRLWNNNLIHEDLEP